MAIDVGKAYISFRIDASGMAQDLVQAEAQISGFATKSKDRVASLAGSLSVLRSEAKQVREQLAATGNFNVRGADALEKLHAVLFGVRDAGAATDKTLDELSLSFEANSRGARTYIQALDKIASDKGASQAVRDLARALSDEAKEANADAAALQKRAAALDRQIASQSRTFGSTLRKSNQEEAPHAVPEQAAASAFVRGAEGQLSIRAGERFLTSTLGLGSALQSIFPVVGGLAMVDIFTNLIDKTQEWHKKLQQFQDAPKLIASAFRQSNDEFRIGNEELSLMNVKLENDIAVLQGRPRNSLKEAIAEATLEADKLADALNKDVEALYKLLQENDVSFIARVLGNQAGTADVKQLIGGDTGVGGLRDQLATIADEASQKRAAIPAGTTKDEQKASKAALNTVNTEERTRTEKALSDALKTVNAELAKSIDLENKRKAAASTPAIKPDSSGNVLGTAVQNASRDQQNRVVDSERRVAELRGVRTRLTEELTRSRLTATNIEDRATKSSLEERKSTEALNAPFQNKINELGGELEKLQASLNAIGQTQTAQILAKGFGDAQAEVARLNNELAKHHHALTLDQQVQLLTRYDEIESTKAEESFQQKFAQTTNSISERITALRGLAAVIGEGYEAQRSSTVENQLSQEFATEYRDPELMRRRQPQIQQRRTQFTTEYDEQQVLQNTQTLDKLGTQISLENSLATAEYQGSEAVRQATLADREANLVKDRGVEAGRQLSASERALSDAQERRRTAQVVGQLEQEIQATTRLTAAQSQGAEAVRAAQLQNRISDIRRSTPAGPEQERQIQDVQQLSAAQRQQEILSNALQTGIAFKDQVQSINEQINALERLRATQGDSLEIEISLKSLEQQRIDVLSRQSLIFGNARDGMRAFFAEMATGTSSAAQQVHDTLGQAFNSLNDTLARLVSGQKVSWGSFFQSISANLAKMSLQNLESQFAAKFFPPAGAGAGAGQASAGRSLASVGGGLLRAVGSLFGGFRAEGGTVSSDQWHVVGEDGPEIFVPGSGGTILPNKRLKALASSSPDLLGGVLSNAGNGFVDAVNPIQAINRYAPGALSVHNLPQSAGRLADLAKTAGDHPAVEAPATIADLLGNARRKVTIGGETISHPDPVAQDHLKAINSHPDSAEAIDALMRDHGATNPRFLAAGAEHSVIDLGNEKVMRLGPLSQHESISDLIASPAVKTQFAGLGVEIYPKLNTNGITDLDVQHVRRSLEAQGLSWPDAGTDNLGRDAKGNLRIFDGRVTKSAPGPILKDFGGFRAEGGTVSSDRWHVVGEDGPEIFVPDDDGTILPNKKLKALAAFNRTETNSRFHDVSGPTHSGGWLAALMGAMGAAPVLRQHKQPRIEPTPASGSKPEIDAETGLPLGHDIPGSPDYSSGETRKPGMGAANLAMLGISSGLGIISMIMNRPKDHHHKAGHAYSIPSFNGAYADGGEVKGGLTHLVGEKGPELFVPKADGTIVPNHKLSGLRQLAETGPMPGFGAAEKHKPFGGYRALGGAVDSESMYMVGEHGPELWTPPSSGGNIVPNHALGASAERTIYIDARNSDPAAVEQRVRQASQITHTSAVRTSFRSYTEYQKRTPQNGKQF